MKLGELAHPAGTVVMKDTQARIERWKERDRVRN